MNREKTSCNQIPSSRINIDSLIFKKCIFMTNDQYNVQKIHKPKQILFIEKLIYANSTIDIDNTIYNIIDEIQYNLNNKYKKTNLKIPHPIFVIIGRELDESSNLFDNEIFIPKPNTDLTYVKYGKTQIPKIYDNKLAILDYINGFFNSGISNKSDEYKYNSSIIKSFKFKGNIRIFLYVPYLTNEYKFISNLSDITNSFYFFRTLIYSNIYMNISRTSTFNSDEYKKKLLKNGFDENLIDYLIKNITDTDRIKYPLYNDLMNLCYEGGCLSDIGDDFNSLIPKFTNDDDTNNKNATDKSPFMPNKCLSKTNGFLCNIKYADNNKDIHSFIQEKVMKDIQENLSSYTEITNKVERKIEISQEESDKITKFSSPINLIISIINKFIKDNYSDNRKDGGKNHYSKDYSQNIIKELAFLNNLNGIPEFVMSLYIFKETKMIDKIAYMPFGLKLPTEDNIFNFDDIIPVNKIIKSINDKYGMILIPNGFVFVFDIQKNEILYFLNKTFIINPLHMTIQENGILISYINNDGNTINRNYLYNLSSLVDNCNDCNPPFSLILNTEGDIHIYANGFYDATSKELDNFIKKEKEFINNIKKSKNFNINNEQNQLSIQLLNIDELSKMTSSFDENSYNKKLQEKYLYRS